MKLVLFDVDHTLMDIGKAHKETFGEAFEEVLGYPIHIREWKYSGYTDLEIIHTYLDEKGIEKDPDTIAKIIKVMIRNFMNKDLKDSFLLDGVPSILNELKDKDVVIGLVTGNLEEIAYTKLKHFNIDEYFIVGGFGDASIVRADLVDIAIEKTEKQFGKVSRDNVYIIGDTIYDIKAARGAGVKVIAIATGTNSVEELTEKNPDFLFEDMKDINKVINVITDG